MKESLIIGVVIVFLLYGFSLASGETDTFHSNEPSTADSSDYSYDSPTDSVNTISEVPLKESEKKEPANVDFNDNS